MPAKYFSVELRSGFAMFVSGGSGVCDSGKGVGDGGGGL